MEFKDYSYFPDCCVYYLGFIPFMIGQGKEAFWFPLAAGTIGGLIASILGIFMFLPIFSLKKQKK